MSTQTKSSVLGNSFPQIQSYVFNCYTKTPALTLYNWASIMPMIPIRALKMYLILCEMFQIIHVMMLGVQMDRLTKFQVPASSKSASI